ncbi:MAG: hypothetical protein HC844_13900 [Tabrizicola sp.]|nr:hypothetical protein [Tabrizicola sp.]
MDWNRLLQGIMNRFMRQAINRGVKAGVDYAARRGKPEAEMTPEEKTQARQGKDLAKRAREAARITRRFGR